MNFYQCPACKTFVHFHRVRVSTLTDVFKKKVSKYQCSNCSSSTLSHISVEDEKK